MHSLIPVNPFQPSRVSGDMANESAEGRGGDRRAARAAPSPARSPARGMETIEIAA